MGFQHRDGECKLLWRRLLSGLGDQFQRCLQSGRLDHTFLVEKIVGRPRFSRSTRHALGSTAQRTLFRPESNGRAGFTRRRGCTGAGAQLAAMARPERMGMAQRILLRHLRSACRLPAQLAARPNGMDGRRHENPERRHLQQQAVFQDRSAAQSFYRQTGIPVLRAIYR